METLREAYTLARENNGAPGIDGVTFAAIEAQGVEKLLEQIQDELIGRTYVPLRARRREIPKEGGKVRVLSIPAIRDRVVQGALKLIMEPIFEADFQSGSYGYRPERTAHEAVHRVATAIVQRKTHVIDPDLRAYFDTVRHHLLLEKVARRINHGEVMRLLKLMLTASGKQGVPQGGGISPLLSESLVIGEGLLDAVVVEENPGVGLEVVQDGRGGAQLVVHGKRIAAYFGREKVHGTNHPSAYAEY